MCHKTKPNYSTVCLKFSSASPYRQDLVVQIKGDLREKKFLIETEYIEKIITDILMASLNNCFAIYFSPRFKSTIHSTIVYSYVYKDERHSLLGKYTSDFIWKGCVWEGVGDRTELQHIDPHSIGHNYISFPFSWAAQLGTWGPSLSRTCSHPSIFSPTHLIFKLINRRPEGSLCWVLAFSTASCHQRVWSPN